jgi:hypothetical protein
MTPKSTTKRVAIQKAAKLERRIEKLESALRVIHTWATYDGDAPNYSERALTPSHVIDLIDRTLDE